MHHNMRTPLRGDDPYRVLTREIAVALCTADPPCPPCETAAYRVVAKRKRVREALVRFAQVEAEVGP